jgi:hypothetical protein
MVKGNRTRRNFKKGVDVTFKVVKGVAQVATLALPGIRGPKVVYKGFKAAQKFAQSKRVEKLLEARQLRRAKKAAAGTHNLRGELMKDVLKKIGMK